MIDTAYINIWGQRVGAVAWNTATGIGAFEYEPNFLQLGWDLSPLMMPISAGARIYTFPELRVGRNAASDTFKGLPGLIADALPDRYGNQLIEVWLAQQGRPAGSMNPVEKLCFIGKRAIGALEFEPAHEENSDTSYALEVNSLVQMASRMLHDRKNFSTNLEAKEEKAMRDILRIGTSVGGARPKALIAYNEQTGAVRSGQAMAPQGFEHWLIKLDGVSDAQFGEPSGYGRIEMAYYHMARDSGIQMMECRLLEENGRAHFMTKRFDRPGAGLKHHIQTWCAMNHYDFNDVRSYSYEQLFQTMRALALDYRQAEQLFRRMVFNVLARNCDDHTKNFSFMLKRGEAWQLTPAYDICHAYRPDSIWVSQHALSINGKREGIQQSDLEKVARSMNIKKASQIIREIDAIVSCWGDYADEVQVDPQKRDQIAETLISYRN